MQIEATIKPYDPVAQSGKAKTRRFGRWVKARIRIADLDLQMIIALAYDDALARACRVTGVVVQRFLQETVDSILLATETSGSAAIFSVTNPPILISCVPTRRFAIMAMDQLQSTLVLYPVQTHRGKGHQLRRNVVGAS